MGLKEVKQVRSYRAASSNLGLSSSKAYILSKVLPIN